MALPHLLGYFNVFFQLATTASDVSDFVIKISRMTLCSTLYNLTKEHIYRTLFQVTVTSC